MPTPLTGQHLQVGAPDPELDTSPIVGDDDEIEVEPNVTEGRCTFNGVSFRWGDYVLSGDELLRCEAPGIWVREGEAVERREDGA